MSRQSEVKHALAAIGLIFFVASRIDAQVLIEPCLKADDLSYGQVANILAPVFWFSPDEPLLADGRRITSAGIPAPLPGDTATEEVSAPRGPGSVVYYRVLELRPASGLQFSDTESAPPPGVHDTKVHWNRLSRLKLRFYSYYPKDIGFGAHEHDLEVIDFTLPVSSKSSGCYELRLSRVESSAHGSDWYTNALILDDKPDDDRGAVLPIHLLVEEGKHATTPDRNADGWFSPGFDVTWNVSDAWGVRDTLRNKRQGGTRYKPENAKDRASYRVMALPRHPLARRFATGLSSVVLEEPRDVDTFAVYELREAGVDGTERYCAGNDAVAKLNPARTAAATANSRNGVAELERFLSTWRFCAPTEHSGAEKQLKEWFKNNTGPRGPGANSWIDRWSLASTSHGVDGGVLVGVSTTMFAGIKLPKLVPLEGWIVPKFRYLWRLPGSTVRTDFADQSRWSADLYYEPSASRSFDWYVGVGAQHDRRDETEEWTWVEEIGVSVRAPIRWLSRLNSLTAVRLGYRGPLQRELSGGHWVVEFGFGGW